MAALIPRPVRTTKACPCTLPSGFQNPKQIADGCSTLDQLQEAISCLEELRDSVANNSIANNCHGTSTKVPLCLYTIWLLNKIIKDLREFAFVLCVRAACFYIDRC